MENHTAKHFALQLGSLVSLYLSLGFFLALVFSLISLIFPDGTESIWQLESASDNVRFGFAMSIVFFPAYLLLTRAVNKNRRLAENGSYLGLTKWLIYISLLVGGVVLLGDLVAVIYGFLEGDLTVQFLLNALAVLVVAGAAFIYYVQDAKGYWLTNEKQSIWYALGASMVIFSTLAVSLSFIQTPAEVRERKVDEKILTDLRDMQWTIEAYLYNNEALPEGIMVAYDGSGAVPTAPADRAPYTYNLTEAGFSLCAEFAYDAQEPDWVGRQFIDDREGPVIVDGEKWHYQAGKHCFEREVRF